MSQPKSPREETLIKTDRNLLMQRLSDCVVNGYPLWVSGGVAENKVGSLVRRFDLNYQVLADRNERARRKRAGLGNARLLLWHDKNAGRVLWWMFVTPPESGSHAAHTLEKLRDMRQRERVELHGFELARLPKRGKDGERFTWRMTEHKYSAWRDSIIEIVRSGNIRELHEMLYGLVASPGFGGIRSQVGKLVSLYRAEIKRRGLKEAPKPPKQLRYLRRLRDTGIPLSQWVCKHGRTS
ncbi:MAG: hypothetical protein M0Z78_05325 [Betaproteobacteria bacterium]|nr:hypothetical protein [Betaproteobacteria bacterium]